MTCKGKLSSGLCHNSVSSVFDCGSSGLDLIPGKIHFFLMMMSVMALDTAKKQSKAVLLHTMEALGGKGSIAPTHS
jgi:hypothetical protein